MTTSITFTHTPAQLNGEIVETVNARDLYERLEVKKDFSNWVKFQIERAGLVENEDYARASTLLLNQQVGVLSQKGENLTVGRPRVEYFLSLEAAKHIAAKHARSQEGRNVYDYFMSNTPVVIKKPMFLSEQFEAYLNLFDADIGGRVQRCVDAQELHQKLGVGNDFTTWVKSRIVQEALEEKVDYLHLKTQVQVPHQGGQRSVNKSVYTLTLETAKIIAAMERNETGRKIRKWLDQLMIQTAVAQAAVAVPAAQPAPVSDSLSKPMFLSDQFEAYLKVVEMELDGRVQRLVDLRSLYEKLGVRDNYRDWAPRSLTNSRSVEGVHYSPRVDPRTVPHSSGRSQRKESKDYFVCFEKAKIIAARSDAENSLDICEWLVRVEEQVRQQTASNAPQSRIELARQLARTSSELVATLEREEVLSASVNRLSHTIASNVLTPRPAFEENAEGIALQRIKREIAPYLSVKVIAHVLKHFGQKRTYVQYGDHENQVVKPFVREGVENAITQFLDQAERRVSYSRKSVVLTHDCLLGDEAMVSAEDAVEYLGYSPDDFGLANS